MLKRTLKQSIIGLLLLAPLPTLASEPANCPTLLQTELPLLHSSDTQNLCAAQQGKVLLIVNTASRCGYTPQLKGLEALHQTYKDRGFTVLGFPSDDFNQELDNEKDIAHYCKINFGVSFPMFAKSHVKGDNANPVHQQLISQTGQSPRWNFFKYLVGKDGKVIAVYPSQTEPQDAALTAAIEQALQ